MTRLTDDEVRALTDAQIREAVSFGDQLAVERRRNENYFLALPVGDLSPPEIEGRSSVVDTTFRDTVLGMEAPLIKTFCGTDKVVEFTATSEDDEEKADQATDYINHVLRKKNPGYLIISTWIRDALSQKFGIIKVWWDDSDIETKEEYRGQTPEQLAMLLDDDEIVPTAQKSYPDPEAEKQKASALEQMQAQLVQMQQAAMADPQAAEQFMQAAQQFEAFQAQPVAMLYDIECKRVQKGGKACIENVPQGEFLFNKSMKTLDTATFLGHRVKRTIGYLKARGYKNVDRIQSDDHGNYAEYDYYGNDRHELADGNHDENAREVWITECYVFGDLDGTGTPEWTKVVRGGGEILERETVDGHPFIDLQSIPLAHRFVGLCPGDLAIPGQKLKTALIRSALDNVYMQVNGRTYAVNGEVNLDDLLNNRPGGVVRVKSPTSVGPLVQGMGDMAGINNMLDRAQTDSDEGTGWMRNSQGGNGLQLSETATQANIVTNRADSRVEIISRTMAETGFTALFRKLFKLITQHQQKAEHVKLSGKWVLVDPREWTNQFDLSINVGLGTGNKDQQVQHLMALSQQQQFALQVGTAKPKNVWALQAKLSEALGYKNGGDLFFSDPTAPPDPNEPPPAPPPPDPAIVKAQMDAQAKQAQLEFEREKAQIMMQADLQKAQLLAEAQMQVDQNRQQLEAEQQAMKIQLEAQLAERVADQRHTEQLMKLELEREKLAMEKYRIDMQNDADIVKAQLAAQVQSESLAQAAEESNQDMANDA